MSKRILRNFRYLNNALVDSYLAQYEGEFLVDDYRRKDAASDNKGLGLDLKIPVFGANGKVDAASSSEMEFTLRDIPDIKFNRLYDLFVQKKSIQPLNGFDQKVYNQIEPNELVEVRGKARLPDLEHLRGAMSGFSYVIEWMKKYGQEMFASDELQNFEAFQGLASQGSEDWTMLIVAPIGSPRFQFVAKLDAGYIRGRKESLEGEVTILGQVLQRLAPGGTIEVYPLLKKISHLQKLQNMNRENRRAATKLPPTQTPLDEAVKYPAIEIEPIAVFLQIISRQPD